MEDLNIHRSSSRITENSPQSDINNKATSSVNKDSNPVVGNNHPISSCLPSVSVTSVPSYGPNTTDNSEHSQVNTRQVFTVPYKGRPRGKCKNWENCEQCSVSADCGECTNCLDKTLQ